MKIIFSRKGFDGTAGGCPSPVVAGQPISLPIPTRMPTPTRYGDLKGDYASLVGDLTQGNLAAERWCHLDPDIYPEGLPRMPGWRGTLGQALMLTHEPEASVEPYDALKTCPEARHFSVEIPRAVLGGNQHADFLTGYRRRRRAHQRSAVIFRCSH